jgi:hypothetical protein
MFSSEQYLTFVAMPLRERFSYHPNDILEKVIQCAASEANRIKRSSIREFQMPQNMADKPGTANVITEDIVKEILFSHFLSLECEGFDSPRE